MSGSIVTFYATGWQSNFGALEDGEVATIAQDLCRGNCTLAFPQTIAPSNPAVLYAGAAPGIVAGVTQFNVALGTLPPSEGTISLLLLLTDPSGASTVIQTVWMAP